MEEKEQEEETKETKEEQEEEQEEEEQEEEQEETGDKPSFVYLLMSIPNTMTLLNEQGVLTFPTKHTTYVGATIDLNRRLRQHNGELKGGAKATTSKVKQGKRWVRVAFVSGFVNWTAALQFEWALKHRTRKCKRANLSSVEKRLHALNNLLRQPKSTSKAKPFLDWPNPPTVHFEYPMPDKWIQMFVSFALCLHMYKPPAVTEDDNNNDDVCDEENTQNTNKKTKKNIKTTS